jgi:hypothetical protein
MRGSGVKTRLAAAARVEKRQVARPVRRAAADDREMRIANLYLSRGIKRARAASAALERMESRLDEFRKWAAAQCAGGRS